MLLSIVVFWLEEILPLFNTVETVKTPRLCVNAAAKSIKCHLLVGAPESTSGCGRHVFDSTSLSRRSKPARITAIQIPWRTSPQVERISLRSSHTYIVNTNMNATKVATAFIKNITEIQPIAPSKEKAQCTLNFGLKEGFCNIRSVPAAIFNMP